MYASLLRKEADMKKLVILGLLLTGCWAAAQAPPTAAAFQSGDRVVFIGDSITRGGGFHAFVQLFYATRFPEYSIQYFNCGHSGGNAVDTMRRLGWDVLDHRPNMAVVMFGMNDIGGGWAVEGESAAELQERMTARVNSVATNMTRLVAAIRRVGCRVTLVAPSIYDETAQFDKPADLHRNAALGLWAQRVRELAVELHTGFADFYTPMNALNRAGQERDPTFTLVGSDRVHPGPVGHFVMAYALLKAQGVPALVAKAELDAAKATVIATNNCRITELHRAGTGLRFIYLANALPCPVPADARPALELVPFMNEMNQELLVVQALKPGHYEVRIDQTPVGVFSAETLQAGVNLAACTNTPMYRQALDVLTANNERHRLESSDLRGLAFVRHAILDPANVMIGNEAAVEKCLADYQAKHPDPKDFGNVMARQYPQWHANENQTRARIAALCTTVAQASKPRPHVFEVVRKEVK